MSAKITRNPAIGGGGGGGGASAADVAAAVVAALPATPAPSSVRSGQVLEFAVGAVPAGFTQIGGTELVLPADTGRFSFINLQMKTGFNYSRLCAAGGRLFAAGSVGAAWVVQELSADYSKRGSAVTITSHDSAYPIMLLPLSDGKLLRLGGASNNYESNSVQVYDPATGAWTARAPSPVNGGGMYSRLAQAGDGKIYGVLSSASSAVSVFDYTANTWTAAVATAPAVSSNTVSICKLPSGKLLWCTTTGQYVFDPAALTFTPVGAYTGTVAAGSCLLPTATGARMYLLLNSVVSYYEYHEATNTWAAAVTDTPKLASATTTYDPIYGVQAELNPYTGAVVLKSVHGSKSDVAYLHLLGYTPVGTVKAVKQ